MLSDPSKGKSASFDPRQSLRLARPLGSGLHPIRPLMVRAPTRPTPEGQLRLAQPLGSGLQPIRPSVARALTRSTPEGQLRLARPLGGNIPPLRGIFRLAQPQQRGRARSQGGLRDHQPLRRGSRVTGPCPCHQQKYKRATTRLRVVTRHTRGTTSLYQGALCCQPRYDPRRVNCWPS